MTSVPTKRNVPAGPLDAQVEALGGKVIHSGETDHLMDEADQEKIVQDLRASMESQNWWSRWPLCCIFFGLGVFTAWRAWVTYLYPDRALKWQEGGVQEPLNPASALLTFVTQAGALLCAAVIISGPSDELTSDLAKVLGTLCAVVPLVIWALWTGIMWDAALPRAMLWVPLSGPFAVILAWYIDSDMVRLREDVTDLDKMRYAFKDV